MFVIDDDIPEVAENFTIELYPGTVSGDAVVVQPHSCTLVIEPNDNANGVLSIDTSRAESFPAPYNVERAFVVNGSDAET